MSKINYKYLIYLLLFVFILLIIVLYITLKQNQLLNNNSITLDQIKVVKQVDTNINQDLFLSSVVIQDLIVDKISLNNQDINISFLYKGQDKKDHKISLNLPPKVSLYFLNRKTSKNEHQGIIEATKAKDLIKAGEIAIVNLSYISANSNLNRQNYIDYILSKTGKDRLEIENLMGVFGNKKIEYQEIEDLFKKNNTFIDPEIFQLSSITIIKK